jgi:hypothetical protein
MIFNTISLPWKAQPIEGMPITIREIVLGIAILMVCGCGLANPFPL